MRRKNRAPDAFRFGPGLTSPAGRSTPSRRRGAGEGGNHHLARQAPASLTRLVPLGLNPRVTSLTSPCGRGEESPTEVHARAADLDEARVEANERAERVAVLVERRSLEVAIHGGAARVAGLRACPV